MKLPNPKNLLNYRMFWHNSYQLSVISIEIGIGIGIGIEIGYQTGWHGYTAAVCGVAMFCDPWLPRKQPRCSHATRLFSVSLSFPRTRESILFLFFVIPAHAGIHFVFSFTSQPVNQSTNLSYPMCNPLANYLLVLFSEYSCSPRIDGFRCVIMFFRYFTAEKKLSKRFYLMNIMFDLRTTDFGCWRRIGVWSGSKYINKPPAPQQTER